MLNGKATIILLTAGLIKKHNADDWIFSGTEIVRSKKIS